MQLGDAGNTQEQVYGWQLGGQAESVQGSSPALSAACLDSLT